MLNEILFNGPIFFMICCEWSVMCVFSRIYAAKRKENTVGKSKTATAHPAAVHPAAVLPAAVMLLTAVILLAAVLFADYYLVDFETASTALEPLFCFAAVWFYAAAIFRIPVKEAFYITVWSYLVTEIGTQVMMPTADMVMRNADGVGRIVLGLCCYAVGIGGIAALVKVVLMPRLCSGDTYYVDRQKILYCVLVTGGYLLLSNYQFIFWLLGEEPETGSNMITFFRLVVGILCVLFLYVQHSIETMQRAEQEVNVMQQLLYRQQEQYRISQENMDLINRKCHDLRYQMEMLRKLKDEKEIEQQLKEMERSAMIYDSIFKTGNPVLDTVLTEKSLLCEANRIQMTCMADGEKLNFIGKVDLYTLFGNALDNAIECVMKIEDTGKRVIQVAVFYEKNLLMIRIRNYCEEKLEFQNGLPISTKNDPNYHGYGLKSIQYTAEKYGGWLVCQNPENYFVLQILLPIAL